MCVRVLKLVEFLTIVFSSRSSDITVESSCYLDLISLFLIFVKC